MTQARSATRKQAEQARNREIIRFAGQLMKSGIADSIIQTKIMEMGLTLEQASAVVNTLRVSQREVRRKTGRRNMIIGAVVLIVGIGIAVFTLSTTRTNSITIVTWGAIFFGILQLVSGYFQFRGK